jgi:drug/metabolite transporter (DMT)-like permease
MKNFNFFGGHFARFLKGMADVPVSGVLFSVASSLLWGCYPVLGRYLQTREPGQPSAVACLALLTSLDAVLLLGFVGIDRSCSPPLMHDQAMRRKRGRFAAGYGCLCIVRMWTNLQSTRMTAALNIQVTALMLPFVTAALSSVLLHERIHWALPPTLITSVVGALLAIAGQGAFSNNSLSWLDGAGIALQLLSVVCSAAVKVALKGTEGVLGKAELMLSQVWAPALLMPHLHSAPILNVPPPATDDLCRSSNAQPVSRSRPGLARFARSDGWHGLGVLLRARIWRLPIGKRDANRRDAQVWPFLLNCDSAALKLLTPPNTDT